MAQKTISIPITVRLVTFPVNWRLTTTEGPEDAGLAVFSSKYQSGGERKILEAWSVRGQFLKIDSVQGLQEFLRMTGTFHLYCKQFDDLTGWQRVIGRLAELHPKDWSKIRHEFGKSKWRAIEQNLMPHVNFDWKTQPSTAIFSAAYTLRAILATIQVDHLRGAMLRCCERDGCRNIYEVTSGHARKYCTWYCAHLVSLKKTRAAAKFERESRHARYASKPGNSSRRRQKAISP